MCLLSNFCLFILCPGAKWKFLFFCKRLALFLFFCMFECFDSVVYLVILKTKEDDMSCGY